MIGKLVRERREEKGWTQSELALAAGLRQTYISQVEQGSIAVPRDHNLDAIGKALGITRAEFYRAAGMFAGIEESPAPAPPSGTRGLQCNRQPEGPNRCLPGAPRRRPVEHYEAAVAAWIAALPDEAYLMEAAARLAPPGDPAHEQLVAIRAERVRLREAYRANLYTTAEMQQQAAALDERERAIAPATPGAARYAAELATLRDAFPTLPPVAQNAALAALVEAVTITGPNCAIAPHPQLARLLSAVRGE